MSNTANNVKVRETTCSEELMAIRDSLDILGGKWKLMILRYLSNRQGQDIHFKKMQREISGISAKMLSKELKDLERNLLITRSVQDQHLIMVYYAITEYGMSVLPLTENLVEWGLYHRQKIKAEMK